MEAAFTPKVFISHATADHRDFALAHRLAGALERCGAQVWIAPDNIPAGAKWDEQIVEGMRDCSHFLLVLSHAAIRSEWVLKEIALARKRLVRDPAFTVLPIPTAKDLGRFRGSRFLSSHQSIPYHDEFGAQLKATIAALGLEPVGIESRTLPLSLPTGSAVRPQALDTSWLVYHRRQAEIIGRESELLALQQFYDLDEPFRWWAIEGPGGVGKSRLVLESLLAADPPWYGGFLARADLASFDFAAWTPDEPVILAIDDAAAAPVNDLTKLIHRFESRSGALPCKVRILLIERAIEGQPWWNRLCSKGEDEYAGRIAHLHTGKALALGRLDRSTHPAVIQAFLHGAPRKFTDSLPDHGPFWDHLDAITDHGRPLFLGVAAAAIAQKGIECLRKWSIADLIQFVHDREERAWERLCPTAPLRRRVRDLVAVATACGGFDFNRYEDRLLTQLKAGGLMAGEHADLWNTAAILTGSPGFSLEPDILGEYYLLQLWRKPSAGPAEATTRKLLCAWDCSPFRCAATIAKTVSDFPESDVPLWWIEIIDRHRFAKDYLHILALYERFITVYRNASQLELMAAALKALTARTRGSAEFQQAHNHFAAGSRIVIDAFAEVGRWPEMREWLEALGVLARRFPTFLDMQRNLAIGARSVVEQCGKGQRWDDLDLAFDFLLEVEGRHPHMTAETLANGAALAIFHSAEADRPDVVRYLAMLLRLHRLRIPGTRFRARILIHVGGNAYTAACLWGKRGGLGSFLWAFGILEDAVAESRGNATLQELLQTLRNNVERSSDLVKSELESFRNGRETLDQIRYYAGHGAFGKTGLLIRNLQALTEQHPLNWTLKIELARALAEAIALDPLDALVEQIRSAVDAIPIITPQAFLAADLAARLKPIRAPAVAALTARLQQIILDAGPFGPKSRAFNQQTIERRIQMHI